MIRPVGRLGAVKVTGLVLWQLRYDLLGMLIVAGLLMPVPDATQIQYATAVLSVLGIGASVFIGFRNTTAYNRWWEARTLWGGEIIYSRVLHNGLTAVDTGSAAMALILDRMRRRQVRYCWQLAAEMRAVAPVPGVTELTPEDPPGSDATDLLNRQAADVQALAAQQFHRPAGASDADGGEHRFGDCAERTGANSQRALPDSLRLLHPHAGLVLRNHGVQSA